MKKTILLLFLSLNLSSFSQNYSTAIGIKSGYPGHGSLNLKKFMSENIAIDVLAGSSLGGDSKYFWAQCLFEKNKNIVNTSGFNWYYGAGPAAGYFVNGGQVYKDKYYNGLWLSIDGAIGIEYTASSIPLNIGLETGPMLNVIPFVRFGGMGSIFVRIAIQ